MAPAPPPAARGAPCSGDASAESAAMTPEERFAALRGVAEECDGEEELRRLLREEPHPVCYDGFEPSGRMHIAQGVGKAIHVKKMVRAGCRVKIMVADYFALLNKKMGGDLDAIRAAGHNMIEVWKALGMDLDGVEFLWSSEEIRKCAGEYWAIVLDIAQRNCVERIISCTGIMGRSAKDDLTSGQFMYPLMQCADIFFLKIDICQMGMDQRVVNVLARDYCEAVERKNKPIILSHHMLPGLKEDQHKMSNSDPSSAIFMEDDESVVNQKNKESFLPTQNY